MCTKSETWIFLFVSTIVCARTVNSRSNFEYYVAEGGTELVRFVPNGMCEIFGAKNVIDLVLMHADKSEVRILPRDSFVIPLRNCTAQQLQGITDYSHFPSDFPYTIFPGTKWCGEGNVAENFYDLGHFNELDKCCREHDFCADYINPRSTRRIYDDLLNIDVVATGYHCDCDNRFMNCLKHAEAPEADMFGVEYFTHRRKRCFKLEYPESTCLQWDGLPIWGTCRKYELNYWYNERFWQFFGNEVYVLDEHWTFK
ncbi:unnamed protein product [Notodromas monacha]|uniref:Phospholipase A2-like central domain-containing protein n=1 Tax=Notodromas monacha TaxID=399045 RepID=A0A7R9BFM0_9CRUS|nr:unnamed protein product [Notodromas monacha]CAG0914533.1 unnamed protein product [Notodromas monacha]